MGSQHCERNGRCALGHPLMRLSHQGLLSTAHAQKEMSLHHNETLQLPMLVAASFPWLTKAAWHSLAAIVGTIWTHSNATSKIICGPHVANHFFEKMPVCEMTMGAGGVAHVFLRMSHSSQHTQETNILTW